MMRVQSHFVSATHSRMRTFRRLAVGLLVGGVFVAMPRDALPSQVISLGLAPVRGGQYPAGVAETTANRIGVRNSKRADDRRLAVFFCPHVIARPQWSGLGGGAFGHAGFLFRRYANPAMCPATPIGVGGRVRYPEKGGRSMRPVLPLAHTGQNSSLIQLIISDALRAAATVDTYQSALDVTGAALVAISALVRAEVRNG